MAGENGRLEALRKRAAEIKAQLAEEEAKVKTQQRKDDTREKVLIGAAFLADMEKNPDTRQLVAGVLERAIVAPKDRAFLKGRGWFKRELITSAG